MFSKHIRRLTTISPSKIRNIAIIAHVDHGKTTLVDKLLKATNSVGKHMSERVMDSGDIEKERGITILSKCTSVFYKDHLINLVDTPGHSDFGGEVERILKMVDGVMLLVDVAEGPMAQTKFVLSKSLRNNLPSIVVLNKVDRNEQRAEDAEIEVMELYGELKAPESLMDYPVCYASSKEGWAVTSLSDKRNTMTPLLDTILYRVHPPKVDIDAPFKFLVSLLSYDHHLGRIVTGRVNSGRLKVGQKMKILNLDAAEKGEGKATKITSNRGISQLTIPEAIAGDIVSLSGFGNATVADTICDKTVDHPLKADKIDPPTLEVELSVNTSPLQGKEGNKLTSGKIWERLKKEANTNVTIMVNSMGDGMNFSVKGRGELQLDVLFETMRREGYEIQVSPPKVIMEKTENGKFLEPYEMVNIEVDEKYISVIIEVMAKKKSELIDMLSIDGSGKSKLIFESTTRALIGFESELKNLSRGTAIMDCEFKKYGPYMGKLPSNRKGSIISLSSGITTSYALANIESRGILFIGPNVEVYPGMIIGETNTDKDLEISPTKSKRLTNIRAAANDENIRLIPPTKMPLDKAIAYINQDELVEITPKAIRLRKKILDSAARSRNRKQNKHN